MRTYDDLQRHLVALAQQRRRAPEKLRAFIDTDMEYTKRAIAALEKGKRKG